MTLQEEVDLIFRENPELVQKSLRDISLFFMVQGEVRISLLRDTLNHKADFFLRRFQDSNPEFADKCLKDWESVSNIYNRSKEDKLECMGE